MMDTEGYIIRRYKDGDEIEINELFNEIFQRKRSLEEWSWKFKKNPLHDVNLTVVAESREKIEGAVTQRNLLRKEKIPEYQGKIVGQYTALPLLFKYHYMVLKFAEPVDNFVHPEFRGGIKGIQRKMYEYHYETCLNEKIAVEFGFPTKAHYIFGKRILKYKDLGQVQVLFRRLNYNLAVKSRLPWLPDILLKIIQYVSSIGFKLFIHAKYRDTLKGIKIRKVNSFDEQFDAFWDRVKEHYEIISVRNQENLNWRYTKPGADYEVFIAEKGKELVGYIVTNVRKTDKTVGRILDLLAMKGADSILIKKALLRFISKKVDFVLCWMLPGSEAYDVLRRLGFSERDAFPPVNIVYRIYNPEMVDDTFVKDLKNWYLTMGDSDVF